MTDILVKIDDQHAVKLPELAAWWRETNSLRIAPDQTGADWTPQLVMSVLTNRALWEELNKMEQWKGVK